MKSKWYESKQSAIMLRKQGYSIKVIENRLGIPRSTLSGWFKGIELSPEQQSQLNRNKALGLVKARAKAIESHNISKALRQQKAEEQAQQVIGDLQLTNAVLDLALAMLYFGEGAKSGGTSIANTNPKILKFVLAVLNKNYGITTDDVYYELHLRADQDVDQSKQYWSEALNVPVANIRRAFIDQRTAGRPSYDHYKGVCVLYCGNIAIQRKLIYLYNLFCDKVIAEAKV